MALIYTNQDLHRLRFLSKSSQDLRLLAVPILRPRFLFYRVHYHRRPVKVVQANKGCKINNAKWHLLLIATTCHKINDVFYFYLLGVVAAQFGHRYLVCPIGWMGWSTR